MTTNNTQSMGRARMSGRLQNLRRYGIGLALTTVALVVQAPVAGAPPLRFQRDTRYRDPPVRRRCLHELIERDPNRSGSLLDSGFSSAVQLGREFPGPHVGAVLIGDGEVGCLD
jgi:hypothetical protein